MPENNPRQGVAMLGGIALIVFGAWFLLRTTGVIPSVVLDNIGAIASALTLIVLGALLIYLSRKGALSMPTPGRRLYRARNDRWLGGVLGGLGAYLGIDPLLLRIIVIVLAVLGSGWLVLAYIVMWVIVPEEPLAPMPPASPTGV